MRGCGLLDFVRTEGKGILGIHAAIDAMYDWPEYGEMMGGYFNLHPWSERVGVELVDPGHPLMAGWRGCPFYVRDEIYQVKEPYSRDNLRVLMRLDTQRTNMNKGDAIRRDDGDFALAAGTGRVACLYRIGTLSRTFLESECANALRLDSILRRRPKCDERQQPIG